MMRLLLVLPIKCWQMTDLQFRYHVNAQEVTLLTALINAAFSSSYRNLKKHQIRNGRRSDGSSSLLQDVMSCLIMYFSSPSHLISTSKSIFQKYFEPNLVMYNNWKFERFTILWMKIFLPFWALNSCPPSRDCFPDFYILHALVTSTLSINASKVWSQAYNLQWSQAYPSNTPHLWNNSGESMLHLLLGSSGLFIY